MAAPIAIAVMSRSRRDFDLFVRDSEPKNMFVDISSGGAQTWLAHQFSGLIKLDQWWVNPEAKKIQEMAKSAMRFKREG